MSDLISRCELFNRLATIAGPPEANDLKAEIYKVIQEMETEPPKVVAQIKVDEDRVIDGVMQRIKEEYEVNLKRGEWEYCEEFTGQDGYKCSECGFFAPWHYSVNDICFISNYHFCPQCGASMEVK